MILILILKCDGLYFSLTLMDSLLDHFIVSISHLQLIVSQQTLNCVAINYLHGATTQRLAITMPGTRWNFWNLTRTRGEASVGRGHDWAKLRDLIFADWLLLIYLSQLSDWLEGPNQKALVSFWRHSDHHKDDKLDESNHDISPWSFIIITSLFWFAIYVALFICFYWLI